MKAKASSCETITVNIKRYVVNCSLRQIFLFWQLSYLSRYFSLITKIRTKFSHHLVFDHVISLPYSTEDDVTMKLSEIVFLNDVIQKHRSTGAPVEMYMVAPPIF